MKTKEQILAWLDKQPWKYEFYEAAVLYDRACLINYNKNFLHNFEWSLTKQGFNVWRERNEEYLKWYDAKDKPRSWEEYCDMDNPVLKSFVLLTAQTNKKYELLKCGMPDELCEAFSAYAKLIQLRNAWVKDYDNVNMNYRIMASNCKIDILYCCIPKMGLSFPTQEMADEFADVFKDLLEIAKPLL